MNTSLLERIAYGDVSAVQECLDSYGSLVWTIARRLSPDKQQAEEATQEIFLTLWRYADRYQPSSGSEAVFIIMIARRRLIDRLRASQRQAIVESLPEELEQLAAKTQADEAAAAAVCSDAALAARALAQLQPEQQTMLKLSILLGLNQREIADATGTPLNAVKHNIRQGLLQIRQLMSTADIAQPLNTLQSQ